MGCALSAAALTLHDAAARGELDKLRAALDAGGDVEARNKARALLQGPAATLSSQQETCTPLHCAAIFGQVEAVKLLLARGANMEASRAVRACCSSSPVRVRDPCDRTAKLRSTTPRCRGT